MLFHGFIFCLIGKCFFPSDIMQVINGFLFQYLFLQKILKISMYSIYLSLKNSSQGPPTARTGIWGGGRARKSLWEEQGRGGAFWFPNMAFHHPRDPPPPSARPPRPQPTGLSFLPHRTVMAPSRRFDIRHRLAHSRGLPAQPRSGDVSETSTGRLGVHKHHRRESKM